MTETFVWLDGQVQDADSARIRVLDHGLTVGDGVFETCKVVHGKAFALGRHLRRLERSAAVLGLDCPKEQVLREAVDQLLPVAADLALGRLRITVTSGPGPLGSGRGQDGPTLMLALRAAAPWPDRVGVVTVPWRRNEHSAIAGAKTTSYAENVVILEAAHRRGADEALLANTAGMLCEGTGSNVMLVLGDRLITPPLHSGCLAGITRELFLEWAAKDGLEVAEDDVPMEHLPTAQDVLLMSSTRDVQPVATLDGRPIEGSALGRAASAMFARYAREATEE